MDGDMKKLFIFLAMGLVLLFLYGSFIHPLLFPSFRLMSSIQSKNKEHSDFSSECKELPEFLKLEETPKNIVDLCVGELHKIDPETALFYCSAYDKNTKPILTVSCTEAADYAIDPEISRGDYIAASEKYKKIAETSLRYFTANKIDERFNEIRYFNTLKPCLDTLNQANLYYINSNFINLEAAIDDFWDLVERDNLGEPTRKQVISTVEGWIKIFQNNQTASQFGIFDKQVTAIKHMISRAEPGHPVWENVDRLVDLLVQRGIQNSNGPHYFSGLHYLTLAEDFDPDGEVKKKIETARENIYKNSATSSDGDVKEILDEIAQNRCVKFSSDNALFPALGRTATEDGKFVNCMENQRLPDHLLAKTLGNLKYKIEMKELKDTKKFLKDCLYTGDRVVHLYTADFELQITNIISGQVAAKTILPSESGVCTPGALFQEKETEFDDISELSEDQITEWVESVLETLN